MVSWKSSYRKYASSLFRLPQNITSINLTAQNINLTKAQRKRSKQNKGTIWFNSIMEKKIIRVIFCLGVLIFNFYFFLSLGEVFFKVWCGAEREILFKLRNLLLLVLCLHSFKNKFWYLWGIALHCVFLPYNKLIRCQVLNAEFIAFKRTLMKTKEFGIWIVCVYFWKHLFILRLQNNDNP